jgi:M6 family metalloprotease-like protein
MNSLWRSIWFLVMMSVVSSQGAPFARRISFTQADGTGVQLWGQGTEFHAVFETLEGYTVVYDPIRRSYCFARLSPDGSSLVSTGVPAHTASPESLSLPRHLRDSPARRKADSQARRLRWESAMQLAGTPEPNPGGAGTNSSPPLMPVTGAKAGLTLLVDFMDVPARIPREEIERFCNQTGYSGYGNNGSVCDYFQDNSARLLLYTNVVTAYVRVPSRKTWYGDVTKDCGDQGRQLLNDALAVLKRRPDYDAEILPTLKALSTDSRNRALACNVLYAGGNGGVWSQGLWPHSSALAAPVELFPGGPAVWRYQISNLEEPMEIGTFCHENGHMLCSFPDIYDYDMDSSGGAGWFCLMNIGNYGGGGQNPTQICAYLKLRAGWASVTELNESSRLTGRLAAFPEENFNHFYRYGKPGTPTEYFLLECRHQSRRDAALPSSGLAVWHIDELGDHNNQGLAANNAHANYAVTLVQADNRYHLQRNENNGDSNDLFFSGNPTPGYLNRIADDTVPAGNWWNGDWSGLVLHDFSAAAPIMSFEMGDSGPPAITLLSQDASITLGQTATFKVQVRGARPLTYQWLFKGTNLPGANKGILEVTALSPAQTGPYGLIVSNSAGVALSPDVNLTVLSVCPLAQALDAPNWLWTTGGQAVWEPQSWMTHDGLGAAVSGVCSNRQSSWVETHVQGPGILSFWWKVSSEAAFDRLRFFLDGNEQARISGAVDWTPVSCSIVSGDHIVRWSYDKDENYRAGSDRGWLDQVTFTDEATAAARLALYLTSDHGISLALPGAAGTGFVVEYRDSLANDDSWKVLNPVTTTTQGSVATDFVQTNRSRFYRVKLR